MLSFEFGNISDEQDLQNNFNRKYLYNSKMIVKFLTKLVGCAKKNIYGLRNIQIFPFSNQQIITLPVQSVPITTKVMKSNTVHSKVYLIDTTLCDKVCQ